MVLKHIDKHSDQAFLRGHTENISNIALSRSGKLLATAQKADLRDPVEFFSPFLNSVL